MNHKFAKLKAGFTLVELLIVIAIMMTMTTVLLLMSSKNTGSQEVNAVAQQISAQLRGLQNEALTGQRVNNIPVCRFVFDSSATTSYKVSYDQNCSGTSDFIGSGVVTDFSTDRVKVSPVTVSYASPRGDVSMSNNFITITSNRDSSVQMFVTLGLSGNVEIASSLALPPPPSAYSCQGSVAANSQACSGTGTGLTSNLNYSLVGSCSASQTNKCESSCSLGFALSGGSCVAATYSCQGSVAANSQACSGTGTGLTSNLNYSLVGSCSASQTNKCESSCSSGYTLSGGACVAEASCNLGGPLGGYGVMTSGENVSVNTWICTWPSSSTSIFTCTNGTITSNRGGCQQGCIGANQATASDCDADNGVWVSF